MKLPLAIKSFLLRKHIGMLAKLLLTLAPGGAIAIVLFYIVNKELARRTNSLAKKNEQLE
jgi:hypothetical protein